MGGSSAVLSFDQATPETQSQLVSQNHPSRHSLILVEDVKTKTPDPSEDLNSVGQHILNMNRGHVNTNVNHANIKQRYLEEIQAASRLKAQEMEKEAPEKQEEVQPNIFFHSLSDKPKIEEVDSDKVDPKTDQKLFKFMFRKNFRMKA